MKYLTAAVLASVSTNALALGTLLPGAQGAGSGGGGGGGMLTPTYFVDCTAGSDTNPGTSSTLPWQHAPGDANATGTSASTTLVPGNVVAFKSGTICQVSNLAPGSDYAQIVVSANGAANNPIIFEGNGQKLTTPYGSGTSTTLSGMKTVSANFSSLGGGLSWANITLPNDPVGVSGTSNGTTNEQQCVSAATDNIIQIDGVTYFPWNTSNFYNPWFFRQLPVNLAGASIPSYIPVGGDLTINNGSFWNIADATLAATVSAALGYNSGTVGGTAITIADVQLSLYNSGVNQWGDYTINVFDGTNVKFYGNGTTGTSTFFYSAGSDTKALAPFNSGALSFTVPNPGGVCDYHFSGGNGATLIEFIGGAINPFSGVQDGSWGMRPVGQVYDCTGATGVVRFCSDTTCTAPATTSGAFADFSYTIGNPPTVANGGTGYTIAPTVGFTGGTLASGPAATGTATLDGSGHINGVTWNSYGSYSSPPVGVTLTGGNGSGAALSYGGSFSATISGTTLTVSGSVTGPALAIGQLVSGAGVTSTRILSGSGTTWTVDHSQSITGSMLATGQLGQLVFLNGKAPFASYAISNSAAISSALPTGQTQSCVAGTNCYNGKYYAIIGATINVPARTCTVGNKIIAAVSAGTHQLSVATSMQSAFRIYGYNVKVDGFNTTGYAAGGYASRNIYVPPGTPNVQNVSLTNLAGTMNSGHYNGGGSWLLANNVTGLTVDHVSCTYEKNSPCIVVQKSSGIYIDDFVIKLPSWDGIYYEDNYNGVIQNGQILDGFGGHYCATTLYSNAGSAPFPGLTSVLYQHVTTSILPEYGQVSPAFDLVAQSNFVGNPLCYHGGSNPIGSFQGSITGSVMTVSSDLATAAASWVQGAGSISISGGCTLTNGQVLVDTTPGWLGNTIATVTGCTPGSPSVVSLNTGAAFAGNNGDALTTSQIILAPGEMVTGPGVTNTRIVSQGADIFHWNMDLSQTVGTETLTATMTHDVSPYLKNGSTNNLLALYNYAVTSKEFADLTTINTTWLCGNYIENERDAVSLSGNIAGQSMTFGGQFNPPSNVKDQFNQNMDNNVITTLWEKTLSFGSSDFAGLTLNAHNNTETCTNAAYCNLSAKSDITPNFTGNSYNSGLANVAPANVGVTAITSGTATQCATGIAGFTWGGSVGAAFDGGFSSTINSYLANPIPGSLQSGAFQ